jgi:AraC-like DNA-binding protein
MLQSLYLCFIVHFMINDVPTDILSAALMKMKLKTSAASAIDAGGNWAIEIPEHQGFRLNHVLRGECWVSLKGSKSNYHLKAGDCFLTINGPSRIVANSLFVKRKVHLYSLFKDSKNGVITLNGGGGYFGFGTVFQFDGHLPRVLFARLPQVIHVPAHSDEAAILRWSLERFATEFFSRNIGRSLILNHLAPIMLLQIFRIYLSSAKRDKNWLIALADAKLSKAMEAVHLDYQMDWSLDKLAEVAGMSRSGFALNFKKQIGIPPMDYLTNWRMQIACELLEAGDKNVSTVASAVGYESESAFSVAFKKIIACRPGAYQRNLRSLSLET